MLIQTSLFNEPLFDNKYNVSQLRQMSEEGSRKCRCCGSNIRVYRRKLNSGMARVLCWFVANRMGEWTHIAKIPAEIERQKNADTAKRSSGVWRVTNEGISFVLHGTKIPSHAFCSVPGHIILGFENDLVTIHNVLKERFDYAELMQGGNGATGAKIG